LTRVDKRCELIEALANASFVVFNPDHRRNIGMPGSDPRFARHFGECDRPHHSSINAGSEPSNLIGWTMRETSEQRAWRRARTGRSHVKRYRHS
jgi:hypothetical protein